MSNELNISQRIDALVYAISQQVNPGVWPRYVEHLQYMKETNPQPPALVAPQVLAVDMITREEAVAILDRFRDEAGVTRHPNVVWSDQVIKAVRAASLRAPAAAVPEVDDPGAPQYSYQDIVSLINKLRLRLARIPRHSFVIADGGVLRVADPAGAWVDKDEIYPLLDTSSDMIVELLKETK